jgi:pyrroline-5-carboxylate reductase
MNLLGMKFAVIGLGNIGQILVDRLNKAGVDKECLIICDNDSTKTSTVAEKYAVTPVNLLDEAVRKADAILIATPPRSVLDIVHVLANQISPSSLIVSFAAAVPIKKIEEILPAGTPVVRIMPNAPSLLGQGMNPVVYGLSISAETRELVEAILDALGKSVAVRDYQMNWCVGLSGAAMRSLLPVLEGMIAAGIEAGLSRAEARHIAGVVMRGTASLVLETNLSLEQIKTLTPMQTVDEMTIAQLFHDAAMQAKEKMDTLQQKLAGE